MRFETKAVHAGEENDFREGADGDVVTPIHLASTFAREKVDAPTGGYEYSREGNPTRSALEQKLAAVEGARYALAFASGLATESVIIMSLLRSGDHVIAFDDLYGGSKRLFTRVFAQNFKIDFSFVDARDPKNISKATRENTRLIWLETPTNPLMHLCDIVEISAMARKQGIVTVVDNTFMSPYFQRPLELGADIVMHSTTKYLNGHCDSVGGGLMLNDKAIFEKLKFNQNAIGAILSPFDSFLVMRGIKTLPIRMERHNANALQLANYLETHPKVRAVHYPGLPSHPQHDLALRQMSGFGGMISFDLDGGLEQAKVFLENLRLFSLAESLGGVESLIEHPALMTHASVPREERERAGIGDSLIRISVGIENVEDLLEDLEHSFNTI